MDQNQYTAHRRRFGASPFSALNDSLIRKNHRPALRKDHANGCWIGHAIASHPGHQARVATQGRYNSGLYSSNHRRIYRDQRQPETFWRITPYRNAYRITQRARMESILAAFGNLTPAACGRAVHTSVFPGSGGAARHKFEQNRPFAP